MGARVALVGDRHQLPAVGRGGVLDLAARWTPPDAHVELDVAHRFTDPAYAAISLALRTGTPTYARPPIGDDTPGERVGEVCDALVAGGQIRIYPSEAERTHALARLAADQHISTGRPAARRDAGDRRHPRTGRRVERRDPRPAPVSRRRTSTTAAAVVTAAGERLGVGDRVATRRNDRDPRCRQPRHLDHHRHRAPTAASPCSGRRDAPICGPVPAGYAREHVELAYATTVYGAQGETTRTGHLVLGRAHHAPPRPTSG